MRIPCGIDTPLGVLRLVQFLYIKHFPFPYQVPYQFEYRKGMMHLEVAPLKRWFEKFIPLLVNLGAILLYTMSIIYLALDEDPILHDIRLWVWMCCIILFISSTFGNSIVLLDTDQTCFQVWERMVEFDLNVRKVINRTIHRKIDLLTLNADPRGQMKIEDKAGSVPTMGDRLKTFYSFCFNSGDREKVSAFGVNGFSRFHVRCGTADISVVKII
ncbi:hypothetical protein Fcan01_10392 [Folsomia candida]|uniref:Uncharacterized protein n=1 Tax=Folsomia candida TaxID=158441 RepID=A0A226EAW3_FOLCA|nr:hypothetical protein Fcan01_10392 [Folsomia candida]